MISPILHVEALTREYRMGSKTLPVLQDVTFGIGQGETVAIVGPSGSGKTTLLGLCAGLDRPTRGDVHLCGENISTSTEDQRAKLRNQNVGFVFQSFHLVPTLTALENVMVPMELRGDGNNVSERALELLEKVGLTGRTGHYPAQLSGGEQQRVAIARAFINQPTILFADEPTGNLDNATGTIVEDLLFDLNEHFETTLVLVTHDLELAERCSRVIQLKGGRVVSGADTPDHSGVAE